MLFIPVCTLSPTCSSDIVTNSPFSRETLAVDGKQLDDDDDDDGGGSGTHSENNTMNNIVTLDIHRLTISYQKDALTL